MAAPHAYEEPAVDVGHLIPAAIAAQKRRNVLVHNATHFGPRVYPCSQVRVGKPYRKGHGDPSRASHVAVFVDHIPHNAEAYGARRSACPEHRVDKPLVRSIVTYLPPQCWPHLYVRCGATSAGDANPPVVHVAHSVAGDISLYWPPSPSLPPSRFPCSLLRAVHGIASSRRQGRDSARSQAGRAPPAPARRRGAGMRPPRGAREGGEREGMHGAGTEPVGVHFCRGAAGAGAGGGRITARGRGAPGRRSAGATRAPRRPAWRTRAGCRSASTTLGRRAVVLAARIGHRRRRRRRCPPVRAGRPSGARRAQTRPGRSGARRPPASARQAGRTAECGRA